ncbi:L domain-like superfamily protein [Klebsormidium nitens]|uniref:L domain-like superfamily protein n=1 Tax=Klebsormidium nitens TaxID=105231 RepID=A0A1Y1HJL3_KLENI|nr:L domain-like superfamily protein [Klebsormidium nitens]|eukprot:GAQ78093.1 L domain-like superfamily protein [Klebsormidium nitens]
MNNLSGPIPPELGNLTNLVYLEIDKNNLSGPIPRELGTLTYLSRLGLSNNNLSGTIPAELGFLPYASLDLQNNSLSGPIPPSLLYKYQYYNTSFYPGNPEFFGMLSLELNSGRPAVRKPESGVVERHLKVATDMVREGRILEMVDPALGHDCNAEEAR